MRDVDVIVIGAGPCGNMAALELARRGVSVAVLDWRTRIGDKLCTGIIGKECAELFAPAAEHIHRVGKLLRRVALWLNCRRVVLAILESGEPLRFQFAPLSLVRVTR